ncbi:hypothetical protein O9929_16165 [Vibrio lentus]|nr:hypothetical protein [Vibrio lentus]
MLAGTINIDATQATPSFNFINLQVQAQEQASIKTDTTAAKIRCESICKKQNQCDCEKFREHQALLFS